MNETAKIFIIRFPGAERFSTKYACRYCPPFDAKRMHRTRWLLRLGMGECIFGGGGIRECARYPLTLITEIYDYDPVPLFRYVRKVNPAGHVVYLLRNTLFAEVYKSLPKRGLSRFLKAVKECDIRVATFDPVDAERYGFLYTPQFIMTLNVDTLPAGTETPVRDLFFIGKDKGRIDTLLRLRAECRRLGLTAEFRVLPEWRKAYTAAQKEILTEDYMPYEEVVRENRRSRAILDVPQKGQGGLTLRPLEALLLKRKLITAYAAVKAYDFYRKQNVFILGEDNPHGLREFLDSPFEPVPETVMRQYSFDGMLERLYREAGWGISEIETRDG